MMKSIYLDVDDTLNSLTMPILQHYGCPVGPFDYAFFPTHVGYNIMQACVQLGGDAPTDVAEFWDGVTSANLWRSAPKSPQCDLLLDMAADAVGRENVYVATTPTKDPQSHADKLLWIWDNLPSWIHRQYFITPRKWMLGKSGTILFDDHLENCQKFEEEGGESLLLPRPWNPNFMLDTDTTIGNTFDSILERNLL